MPGFGVCAGPQLDELVDTPAVGKRPGSRHPGNQDGMVFRKLDIFVETPFSRDFPTFPSQKQVRVEKQKARKKIQAGEEGRKLFRNFFEENPAEEDPF